MSGDETPSFLRKTVATAVRGNEARQKWKRLEERGRASGTVTDMADPPEIPADDSPNSNSPSRPRTNSVFQIMGPSHLKPRLSLAQDDQVRKNLRTLGSSTAAFEKHGAKDSIERVPLYNGCSARFLEALAPLMHSRLVEAGTDICVEGDAGDCMYILSRGDAQLLKGGEVIETAEDGAVFGEHSSVSKNSALTCRPWTVRATSLCDVKMLSREDVLQVLSHFRDDASLLEKRVEMRIAELQKMGAMPAKKEWWQIRRHSTASNYSEKTTMSKTEDTGNFRAAVGRALTGIQLARRFSVGAGPAAVTMSPASFGALSSGIAGVQRRRMSDSMLTANLASRFAERQNSKSSQISLQSIQERDGAQSASSSSSSSTAAAGSAEPEENEELEVDFQASHSIRVLQAEAPSIPPGENSETADEAYRGMAKGLVHNLLADFEEELDASPRRVLESAGTVKFDALDDSPKDPKGAKDPKEEIDPSPLAVTLVPSLASIERSIVGQDDLSPKESRDDSPSGPSMATIKLPLASRRVLSEEEHRQRDVALHPLNQGGLCGGFPVCASERGIELAHVAALRVCRKAPINGALSRHQQLVGQLRQNRLCKPTVASKSRSWRRTAYRWQKVDEERGLELAVAPPAPQSLTAIWEEFLAKKAAGII